MIGDGGPDKDAMCIVLPETRMGLFSQLRGLMWFMIRARTTISTRIHNLTRSGVPYRLQVARLVRALNHARHVRGLPDITYNVPSYIGMIPIRWEDMVAFQAHASILAIPHLVGYVDELATIVQKVQRAHRPLQFCMVDFERIETPDLCLLGIQVFFGVPMPPGMQKSDAGQVAPLNASGPARKVVMAYVEAFAAKRREAVEKGAREPAPPE